jgi:hypothetical protein
VRSLLPSRARKPYQRDRVSRLAHPASRATVYNPPAALAYDGHPGKPQGMLVYDIELIDFTR